MGKRKLLLATKNAGKVREIDVLLKEAGLEVELVPLTAFPAFSLPPEEGETFLLNAQTKAEFVAFHLGFPALADDSGLEVEALGGKPGVYSARFAGEPPDDTRNNAKLLSLLAGLPWEKRRARFRCAAVLATPEGKVFAAEGSCEGYITFFPAGKEGFGYDPLFFFPPLGRTFAQIPPELKNKVSHRAQAFRKLFKDPAVRRYLEGGS